ncbi:MAG: nickel insertion protein, partial [Pirellula sp.]
THDRSVLSRRRVLVDTPWGKVACKEVIYPDGTRGISPEYEDCRKIAIEQGLKLTDIVRTAEKAGKIDL